VVTSGMRFSFD
jgi:hypothetical protein